MARAQFRAGAGLLRLENERVLLLPGGQCESILFPINSRLRVFQTGAEGREVTLYHIGPSESCVLSASCAIGNTGFPAIARVDQPGRAWAVPAPMFRDWIDRHAFWRAYVFSLIARRLGDVLAKMEDVTFRRIDARLAGNLLGRAERKVVRTTHQLLADELGTAREVVSRTLATWEQAGWVKTSRGRITLIDILALQGLVRAG